jgi:carboxyl-terminal processing protease
MTPRIKLGVVFTSMMLTVMLVLGAVMGKSEKGDAAYRPLSVYSEVLAKIKSDYVEDPNMEEVTRGALQGLVEYLDGSSSYLTASEYEEYLKSLKNDDGGTGLATGMVVEKRAGYCYVLSVLPESPADKLGIRTGDLVEAINGLSTRVMPPAYLHALLSGPPDSTLSLMVRPNQNTDEPKELSLKRSKLRLPPVTHKILEDGVGYIDVNALDEDRVNQVSKAVKSLQSAGARQIVLDLRGSSVGSPQLGVRLANLFVDSGKIATLKGQRYPEKVFEADAKSTVTKAKMVVITDRSTAGAAEIAAAAIMDSGRGEVVGERTYGIAAEQDTVKLEDGAALLISVAKYYSPSGKAMQDEGVTPSIPLTPGELRRYRQQMLDSTEDEFGELPAPAAQTPEPEEGGAEDPYLKKALEVLKGQVVKQAARLEAVPSPAEMELAAAA